MKGPAKDLVNKLLAAAEKESLCCTAQTDTQQRQLSRAVECGLAICPFPRIYTRAEFWNSLDPGAQILMAAKSLQTVHPTWVFAGPTAALFHKLWVSYRYCHELYLTTTRSAHAPKLGSIRRIIVSEDAAATCDNVHVTSLLRTLYDCLRTMAFRDALAIADSALRAKHLSSAKLLESMNKEFAHMPGVSRVRSIIELADPRSENGGESVVRAQIISLGFVKPDLQRECTDSVDPGRTSRVDFAWDLPDGTLVIGELDGKQKYTDENMLDGRDITDVLLAERRREAHLTLDDRPVRVMRFSLADAINREQFHHLLSTYKIPRASQVPAVALSSS